MAPWRPGRANKYPVIIASKIRLWFDYQRLDAKLRMRIRARRHHKGLSLAPRSADDAEATEWIDAQADRWGRYRWTVKGWTKEKAKKGTAG